MKTDFRMMRLLIELANLLPEGGPEMAKLIEIIDLAGHIGEGMEPVVLPAAVDPYAEARKDRARLDWLGSNRLYLDSINGAISICMYDRPSHARANVRSEEKIGDIRRALDLAMERTKGAADG